MASRVQCPKCGGLKSWVLRAGRYRCAFCRYDWRPGRLPLRLTLAEWRTLLRWFIRGLPSALIAEESRLDRKRVLRALTMVRRAMANALPHPPPRLPDSSLARSGPATIALYAAYGRVWAAVLPDANADRFARMLREHTPLHSIDAADPYCAGVVYRGRLYRVAKAQGGRLPTPFGHIEGFWAYLQRQLRAKGGIRRTRLNLYLAEYSWRYNHRALSSTEQFRELLALVRDWQSGGDAGTFPPADQPRRGRTAPHVHT